MAGPAEPRGPQRPGRVRRRSADILLVGDADILAMATSLQNSRQRGVVAAGGLSPEQVAELRAGLSRPFSVRRPVHPMLARQTALRTLIVGDYRSKDTTVTQVAGWAANLGLNARTVASLEQGVDELLLNALYDAPQDASGRPRYMALSPRQRLESKALPGEQAEVRFGADSRRVVVSVRDRFGTLRRGTVLSYLIRCATAQSARRSPLEQKAGGAGVGLYLVAGAASELLFRLRRDRSTEVIFVVYRDRSRPLRALVIDDEEGIGWGRGGPTALERAAGR